MQRLLTAIKDSYLSLKLQGYRHHEANALLGLNAVEAYSVRRSIRDKARDILSDAAAVSYDFSELDELVPAYAMSVHRSQGCEYPPVVIPVVLQHYPVLQRKLLCTAVTRARKVVVLVGSPKPVAIAVPNRGAAIRYTAISRHLSPMH